MQICYMFIVSAMIILLLKNIDDFHTKFQVRVFAKILQKKMQMHLANACKFMLMVEFLKI